MKKILILLVFIFVGCNEASAREFFPTKSQEANQITYVKDSRTNLCFAYNSVTNSNGFTDSVLTNVPCTPEVERLLTK